MYDHVVADKASDNKIQRGVIDSIIPSAVVDSGTASNVGRYGDGVKLTGRRSTKIFKVVTGDKGHQDSNHGARTVRTSSHV